MFYSNFTHTNFVFCSEPEAYYRQSVLPALMKYPHASKFHFHNSYWHSCFDLVLVFYHFCSSHHSFCCCYSVQSFLSLFFSHIPVVLIISRVLYVAVPVHLVLIPVGRLFLLFSSSRWFLSFFFPFALVVLFANVLVVLLTVLVVCCLLFLLFFVQAI